MIKKAYRLACPTGFLIVAAFLLPMWLHAGAATATMDFAMALAALAFVFGLLHLCLLNESQKATMRQLPAFIMVALVSVLTSLWICSLYSAGSFEFPLMLAVGLLWLMLFCLLPLYGIALLIGGILHLTFRVPWELASDNAHSGNAGAS